MLSKRAAKRLQRAEQVCGDAVAPETLERCRACACTQSVLNGKCLFCVCAVPDCEQYNIRHGFCAAHVSFFTTTRCNAPEMCWQCVRQRDNSVVISEGDVEQSWIEDEIDRMDRERMNQHWDRLYDEAFERDCGRGHF